MLTHAKFNPNLDEAKDGRWVLLVGLRVFNPDNEMPPAVLGRFIGDPENSDAPGNHWLFMHVEDHATIGTDDDEPKGFVELSDLGLFDGPMP
jgi:hypothetical protein